MYPKMYFEQKKKFFGGGSANRKMQDGRNLKQYSSGTLQTLDFLRSGRPNQAKSLP